MQHIPNVSQCSKFGHTVVIYFNEISLMTKKLTKHPDIAGRGEPPEVDALRGHPLDGQLALGSLQTCLVIT